MTFSGIGNTSGKYHPIALTVPYDPEIFEPLVSYCLDELERRPIFRKRKFVIQHDLTNVVGDPWKSPGIPAFVATGCVLTELSMLETDRESGEISTLSLTFKPGKVRPSTKIIESFDAPESNRIFATGAEV